MQILSIVIPTKNEEKFLPTVLDEIRAQTFQPIEIIIADAGSTDRTREIAKSYGAKVIEGGLPGVGRNRGAVASRGDLIYFFDADVVLRDSQFLERSVREFEERGLEIATADVGVVEGNIFDRFAHAFYNSYVHACNRFHPHAPGFCILVRKSLHDAIGGFDESVIFCEDHDYALRAAKKGKFGILKSVKVFATTRRQERDGRLSMAVRYILAELHILFIGPIRHNGFKYGFEYPPKK